MNLLFFFLILSGISFSGQIGSVVGEVIDKTTHQPLIGVNVIIAGTTLGAASNTQGKFIIKNVPVGSYTVTASMMGYQSIYKTNVNVYSERQSPIKFYLIPSVLKGEEVTVNSGFFEKAKDAIVSTQTMDFEEIRSDPSGTYDIQRMVQALPSVAIDTDQSNEIIVRGGGLGENLFIMDHLEIPNPNHFGDIGTGGGPINILNTEFVERIDFFAGAFPARYGDKQSSVMDITLREGNYEKFESDLEISMAGIGLIIEGPFVKGKGSYLTSIRQSFLKYVIKSAGLVAIPEYWNTQTKIVYNLDKRNKLMFNAVGGWDYIKVEDENRPELENAENVEHTGYQYTTGVTYKSLFSQKGYTLLSLGRTSSSWIADVYNNDNNEKNTYFTRDNTETDNFLKGDVVYKYSRKVEFSTGFNIKYGEFQLDEISNPDEVIIYYYPDLATGANLTDYYEMIESNPNYEYFEAETLMINEGWDEVTSNGLWKYAGYGQFKVRPHNRITFTLGVRYDNIPYNYTNILSPKIGSSFHFSPLTQINIAYGKYYQTPFYWMLMNPRNPKKLTQPHTDQTVLGVEHIFAEDIKGTLEIYYKTYHNRQEYIADTTQSNFDERLGFSDYGKGRSKGIELFLQKKFADKWYGTFSYSLSKSEGWDPRLGKEKYYPWDFDNEQILTVIGGYKFRFREYSWYQKLKEQFYFSFISWLPFMFADQLEISFRYRYSGGKPYTPKTYDFHTRRWYIDKNSAWNTERYGYYSRFDIMILRRFNFKNINLTTFIDIQNIFDRDNEWEWLYLEDGTKEMSFQYKQMPIGGIVIEF